MTISVFCCAAVPDFALYEAALTALDIPVYADVAADLLDAPHVRPFAALLRVLDNPAQDVELSSVLLSPLYPYTPDDLVQLRAAVRGGSLYAAVLHGSDPRFATVFAGYGGLPRAGPYP